MKIPSLQEAEAMLAEAGELNPGAWIEHSRQVADAARRIAASHPQMDAETAQVLGLLHDIGRREGVTGMRHALDGYRYLQARGYEDAARVCLTHSFPIPFAGAGASAWDGTEEEFRFVQAYLDQNGYNHYDRLIQLCDSLALPSGPCLVEKRLVDVALRYGFNAYTLDKWKAFFAIQAEIEQAIGQSIYALLPGVIENTFGSAATLLPAVTDAEQK